MLTMSTREGKGELFSLASCLANCQEINLTGSKPCGKKRLVSITPGGVYTRKRMISKGNLDADSRKGEKTDP